MCARLYLSTGETRETAVTHLSKARSRCALDMTNDVTWRAVVDTLDLDFMMI